MSIAGSSQEGVVVSIDPSLVLMYFRSRYFEVMELSESHHHGDEVLIPSARVPRRIWT